MLMLTLAKMVSHTMTVSPLRFSLCRLYGALPVIVRIV